MNTFAWHLSAYLADILFLVPGKSDYTVNNSAHFISTIKNERAQDNEVILSFDVESLFTNVSVDDAASDWRSVQCDVTSQRTST